MPSPSQPYVDNPCWGGPQLQQHNLSYLLELISSGKFNIDASNREETIILHNDNDFLVVDKVSVTCNFALGISKIVANSLRSHQTSEWMGVIQQVYTNWLLIGSHRLPLPSQFLKTPKVKMEISFY